MSVAVEVDQLVTHLGEIETDQGLVDVLARVQALRSDETIVVLLARLRENDSPIAALQLVRKVLTTWAGEDPLKKLYPLEVDDIARRVAGDIATAQS